MTASHTQHLGKNTTPMWHNCLILWRHEMENFCTLLTLCRNPTSQRLSIADLSCFFVVGLRKLFNKHYRAAIRDGMTFIWSRLNDIYSVFVIKSTLLILVPFIIIMLCRRLINSCCWDFSGCISIEAVIIRNISFCIFCIYIFYELIEVRWIICM